MGRPQKNIPLWGNAYALWREEARRARKRDIANDDMRAALISETFGNRRLDRISGPELTRWLAKQAKAREWSNATANRYRALISAVWNVARQHYENAPPLPMIRRLKEEKRTLRFLSKEEAERLLAELPMPLRAMAQLSLLTGLRQSNVINLMWHQVDLQHRQIRIPLANMKGKEDFVCPLNEQAHSLLRQLQESPIWNENPNTRWGSNVFHLYGRPILFPAGKQWKAALKRAGIENFRWHDLRRTWASWHAMSGTPLPVLQKLGGWKSIAMVMVYAQLSPDYTSQFASNVSL